jgi:hypothetical protein
MRKAIAALAFVFSASCFAFASLPAPPAQAAGIQIDDAKLGKDVKDREIVDETAEFSLNERVYLWLRVTGGSGESLKVTWKTGEHTFEAELAVGGSPWRTWCYKTAAVAGEWTVTVADAKGSVLKEMKFQVK